MRFDRTIRYEDYIWTRRKELAFLNRHKRIAKKLERDCPLFADQLAPAPETDVEAEKARRVERARRSEQVMRDLDARQWRAARASYFACEPEIRARIMAEWGAWRGPAKPLYFIYVVEKHKGVGEERTRRMRERDAEIREAVLPMVNVQGDLLRT
ncbi:hypothetical protein QZM46_07350 [Burkholderia vietnamiensis]|jgi:hypothetical protein|uniref:Uncharacterized protein n=1 Tax=Burkholderia vietnamiensis TaxID=60552 RepID=A0AAW7T6Q0_BURVI|nr:hypothetical protein [Burkholderia vietnamiensis]MBH9645711.1 hypothetical protein [Burkholderia vietnamiensis]MBR8008282.1 hypothetical protein [Burkholderia vietnamiensis]MBR8217525.1 hypothetical protein [Burkholderia vietnamiensis]MCA8270296.1 hypothetical protein [Burkholderia vietnamiensis]MCA8450246.1 hypothetical protein [Burkholderia vietnamiensis]